MNLRHFVIAFALVAVFALALFNWAIEFQSDNDVSQKLLNDSTYGSGFESMRIGMEDDVGDFESDMNTQYGGFANTTTDEASFQLPLNPVGQFKFIKGITFGFWNTLAFIPKAILGIPADVINFFGGILVLIFLFAILRSVKTGD